MENDEFSKAHVCVLGDVHENVEPLHRSIQKQTDDATKSWEASHLPWTCMLRCGSQRNFQKMQVPMPGFAVVVRSDTSLLVHAMTVQSFLNLGTNQCRASVFGECGRPRLHGEARCLAEIQRWRLVVRAGRFLGVVHTQAYLNAARADHAQEEEH